MRRNVVCLSPAGQQDKLAVECVAYLKDFAARVNIVSRGPIHVLHLISSSNWWAKNTCEIQEEDHVENVAGCTFFTPLSMPQKNVCCIWRRGGSRFSVQGTGSGDIARLFSEIGDSHNKIHVNKASNRWVEEQRELGAFLCHVRLNVHETVRTLTLIASLSLVRRHHLALRAGYCYGERLPMICVTVFVSRITWHPSPVILPFTSRTFVLMAIYYLRRFSREFACCQLMMMKIRRHSCCIIMSFTVEFAEVIP